MTKTILQAMFKSMKKHPKEWAIGIAILAVFGFILQATGLSKTPETPTTETVQVSSSSKESSSKKKVSSSTSNSSKKEKQSTEQSSTAESSSTNEESSSSSKTKDGELPAIEENQMPSFIEYFKQDLQEKGVNIDDYRFYNRSTGLYIAVPNEYKYYDKTQLQQFADGLHEKEHEAFNVWAEINGIDYSQYPMLFIKTDDGDSLASQTLTGKMKLKIK